MSWIKKKHMNLYKYSEVSMSCFGFSFILWIILFLLFLSIFCLFFFFLLFVDVVFLIKPLLLPLFCSVTDPQYVGFHPNQILSTSTAPALNVA